MRKLHLFFREPLPAQLLFLEAGIWMAVIRLLILLIPFRYWRSLAGHPDHHVTTPGLTPHQETVARQIEQAISRISRHAPWDSTCLAQAVTARLLLKRRGIPSAISFGVAVHPEQKLKAHAWLHCGGRILTGESGMEGYREISVFR